jgi:TolB-like protein
MSHQRRHFYEFGRFRVDPARRLLLRDGQPVSLQPKAFDTLLVLIRNTDRVVPKDDLLKTVWPDAFVEESNLAQNIFVLRKALGDSAESHRYIVTVPGRGYRFAEDVQTVPEADATVLAEPPRPMEEASPHGRSGRIMLAVLPLRNLTGDGELEYFADGLTEELITQFGRLDPEQLGVIGRTSVMPYKAIEKSLDQIGRELSVQYIVEGSFRRDPERLRVTVQLIQVKDQSLLWSEGYDQPRGDALRVQDDVAAAVAREIQLRLTPRVRAGQTRPRLIGAEAYEAYLKGNFFVNKRTAAGLRRAIEYFEMAVASEPAHAQFHASLAHVWCTVAFYGVEPPNEALPKAKAAALKALAIDGQLGAAYALLGTISLQYDRDWDASRRNFRRAVQLNPNDPVGHHTYAATYLAAMGEFDEAVRELRCAHELDPLSPSINAALATSLCWAGNWNAGMEQFRKTFEIGPSYGYARYLLSQLYAFRGLYPEAMAEVERIESPGTIPFAAGQRGYIYALQGRRSEALRIADELQQASMRMYVDPVYVAEIHAGLGDADAAFMWLEKAYDQHSTGMLRLRQSPAYERIRADPRFVDLLGRAGIPGFASGARGIRTLS